MKYKTVEDVIDFVTELKPKNTADSQLQIHVGFYEAGAFVGELDRNMCSTYTTTTLRSVALLDYFVTDFKIEIRDYCVTFELSIKKTI